MRRWKFWWALGAILWIMWVPRDAKLYYFEPGILEEISSFFTLVVTIAIVKWLLEKLPG